MTKATCSGNENIFRLFRNQYRFADITTHKNSFFQKQTVIGKLIPKRVYPNGITLEDSLKTIIT
ncbi:hypothetical protein KAH55_02100, partial [bacterium]|nr:hypothetical protein [bacterium]